jgi:ribosomal protein S18 acetylase RimI-like enzyme
LRRDGRCPEDFVLGAVLVEKLAGIVGLQREQRHKRAHRASVWGMYVAAEARGKGVARQLALELISRARKLPGLEQLNLTVMADNAAAVHLYRSLGFEVWGLEKQAMRLDGAYHDELSMGLRL